MMRTPDGHSRLELPRFVRPLVVANYRTSPINALATSASRSKRIRERRVNKLPRQ
jgi:hypothetical protein